ncbi:hypothetical protein T459_23717 [Capsicum annuum]|uniref:Elongation factor Ts, mitochondrial n=1 Tax=Capsicum annuum TaxID=4072 RepID=A0A2G2YT67_CAPAN|nr:hypothetical protein T459_23717 [Capsicum annuum]
MHVVAAKPLFLTKEDVSSDVLPNEREILKSQEESSRKPQIAIEKMVEGRLRKTKMKIQTRGRCNTSGLGDPITLIAFDMASMLELLIFPLMCSIELANCAEKLCHSWNSPIIYLASEGYLLHAIPLSKIFSFPIVYFDFGVALRLIPEDSDRSPQDHSIWNFLLAMSNLLIIPAGVRNRNIMYVGMESSTELISVTLPPRTNLSLPSGQFLLTFSNHCILNPRRFGFSS